MPLRWKLTPGERRARSSMLCSPSESSFSWLKAITVTGTSCRRSSRRVAVTTISSRPLLGAVSASPVAAMAGHASWPTKAVDHKSSLIVSERIAHPFYMLPFPHIPDLVLFGSSGYPLRIEAGLGVQLNTSVNGRSTIFTGNKAELMHFTSTRTFPRKRPNDQPADDFAFPRERRGSFRANISDTTRLIRVDQLRHFPGIRPLHGPAVDGGIWRLADSIDGKHRGVDGPAVGLETQSGIIDAAVGIHFDAPLIELVRHADFGEAQGNRLRTVREQVQVDVAVIGGGAREHRSRQPRLELVQHAHGVEGDAALLSQGMVV